MDSERSERLRYFGFAAFVGLLLLLNLTGYFKTIFGIDTAALITVLAGYRIFFNAISALLEKEISADLAICIAVIAALAVGQYLAAAEAMFIMLVGEGLEAYAAGRTSAAIHRFVQQMPRRARLLRDGQEQEVDASSLSEGDTIVVRAGERIPADGVVLSGLSSVDESTITGEALPREKEPGQDVYSGTLNGNGLLRIRVTRAGQETTLSRVVALVEEAREQRAPVERLADRYARYFLPALLLAAALTFYFTRDWLRTVAVLIVACPCALILATPTAMVAAIGGLARRGILVRGGTVLQQAAKVDTIVFDKTGTITAGQFEIIRVIPLAETEDRLIALAAAAESGSDHVLARVIAQEAIRRNLDLPHVEQSQILPGRGAECTWNGRVIRAGSVAFLAEQGIEGTGRLLEEADRAGATAVLVAEDNSLAGAILLRDRIRDGVREAIQGLKAIDISYQVMLTGDRRRAAEVIAREAGIPTVQADLLPEHKLERVRELASQGRFVAMAGDGVNDAPALAAAHVGIAVHGASDITAEAADVVYLGHSLEKLPKLFEVARRAVATAWQNIILFAGLVNLAAVGLAATGILTPIGAAVTHQLSSFLVMINSLRLLRVERSGAGRWAGFIARTLGRTPLPAAGQRLWATVRSIDLRDAFAELVERRREYARPALIAAVALALLSGVHMIRPNEVGLVERFGRRLVPAEDPGLHYQLPWPIDRLTRVQATKIRTVEIGFRSNAARPDAEPASYEWNVQHRSGRFQTKPEESLMLAGDQNMMEVNVVVHYRLRRPDQFLLRQLDGETTVRSAAEGALATVATTTPLDEILTTGRKSVEARVRTELQSRLDRYAAGVEVLHVQLLDVHPSVEVVDAFREVAGAFEEKNRMINEAEAYRNEQVALSRGNAKALIAGAEGYSVGKKNRAAGDASRFTLQEESSRSNPALTETRLYLETMEQVLPGRKKMIVDSSKGRRHLLLLEDGVEIAPPGAALLAPPPPPKPD
ncbi:MAG TPA: FtsH protease activity modulator HflK [Bryobacteraceae bacterium]|nr:FtsH protease activity modulator HflK [Bryobacteraceae bacterium]